MVVIGILLVAATANLIGIGHKAMWNDEALSFYYSIDGIAGATRAALTDVHPPLYYMLFAFWLHLGEGPAIMRLASAAAMLGATLFVYLAAKRLFDVWVALLAAMLFATNPTIVSWAQKARPYALQTLLVAIAYWGLVAGFLHPDMRRRWLGSGLVGAIRRGAWGPGAAVDVACLAFAICGGLAILTQLPAGFFVLGCNVCIALVILTNVRDGRRLLLNWSAAQLLLIGLWATWFPAMIVQYQHHFGHGGIGGAYQTDPRQLRRYVMAALSVSTVWRLLPAAFALYVACFGLAILRCRRAGAERACALAVVIVPISVCLAGYVFVHEAFGYVISTFVWLLVPYMGFIAYGVLGAERTKLQLALAIPLLALNLIGLRNYYAIQYPRLDAPAAFIARSLRPGDGFVLSTDLAARWGIAYYWRRAGVPINDRYSTLIAQPILNSLADTGQYPKLWVLLPDGVKPRISLEDLGKDRSRTIDLHFDDLRVLRFDRRGLEPDGGRARG